MGIIDNNSRKRGKRRIKNRVKAQTIVSPWIFPTNKKKRLFSLRFIGMFDDVLIDNFFHSFMDYPAKIFAA